MSVEHSVDTPALEERSISLTHVAAWALRRYGLGAAPAVLLDDSTNLVFRILPLEWIALNRGVMVFDDG